MEIATILIALGLLIFFSHVLNALFSKIRVSNVLILILVGLVAGPVMGWFKPSFLGEFGSVFTTITLIVILFESGTSLDLDALKKSILSASLLTLLNFLASMLIGYFLGKLLLNLDNLHSLFLGAALGGTSSAVVIPMVRQLKAGAKAQTSLYIESALSDVFCLVVALALLGGIKTGEISVSGILGNMGISFLFAIALGLASGFFWIILLRKWLSGMSNTMFTSFALAFILYGLAESTGLNGGICILSFGIMVGNIGSTALMKRIVKSKEDVSMNSNERQFFSEIVFVFQTYFFVYIGISIQLNNLWHIVVGLIFVVAAFLIRPITARVLGNGSISLRDRKLVSALGPRGLVAAVLASLPLQAALKMKESAGTDLVELSWIESLLSSGQTIQNVSYALVLISIILSSAWVWVIDRKKTEATPAPVESAESTLEPTDS
jgi:potassium/hydrogen antiporter